jgi:hypothetical protein
LLRARITGTIVPMSEKTAYILLLCLTALSSQHAFPQSETLEPEAEFMTRVGMAQFESVEDLLHNPTKIFSKLDSWQHNENKVIRSETDVHAVYPYPVEYFVDELLNFENTKNIFPRVVDSVLEESSKDPFGLHVLWVHIDVEVLGFGAEYTYVTNNWMERRGEGYLHKYNLNRCPDGTLYQLIGSWYVEEIDYHGTPHTYIRNYSVIGVRKGSIPMELAMRTFGMWQLNQVFGNIQEAVKKRL